MNAPSFQLYPKTCPRRETIGDELRTPLISSYIVKCALGERGKQGQTLNARNFHLYPQTHPRREETIDEL